MNFTSSARRQDQPLKLGVQHGYRIEGDQAFINADINIPQYHSGGSFALELWASEGARGIAGDRSGTKIAEVEFGLATPLAPHTHRVEAQVPARLPLQGRPQRMSLALVETRADGQRSVHDLASYPELETFSGPQLDGGVGYSVESHEVVLDVGGIVNPRSSGNLSGGLSLELWALPLGAEDGSMGQALAAAPLGRLPGQQSWQAFQIRVAYAEPPVGRWQFALLLREWTQSFGYVTRDRRDFALPYERTAPELPAPPVAEAVIREVVAREPPAGSTGALTAPVAALVDPKPTLAPVAAKLAVAAPAPANVVSLRPAAEPAAQARAPRALSIQTASVEELAKIKGLNLRIAKEIVKARPFASLDELLKVNGIGKKTLDRIRSLIRL